MKWLKSTTQKTWCFSGKKIPACVTPDNSFLTLTDEEYAVIESKPIVQSLLKNGAIIVFDEEPAEVKNSLNGLQMSNAQLMEQNTRLQEEVKALTAQAGQPVDIEAIKTQAQEEIRAQAVQELQEKQTALEDATAKLAAAQEEIKALKKKANK